MDKKDKSTLKLINNFILENLDNSKNYVYNMGYKNFGLLLLGFCTFIHSNKEKNQQIFFLSRDGYIVKKAYEILYPKENTKYLYVSRRSLSLPPMKFAKDISEMLDFLILPPMFTINIFLSAFNIKNADKELKKANINKEETFKRSTFKENEKILKLTKILYKRIRENIDIQYDNFINYLKQEGFNNNSLIVDIGWHNSIQKSIIDITKIKNIDGYYIAIYNDAYKFKNSKAFGYLYSYGNNLDLEYRTFSFVSLFETMFLSHEGTTIGYKKENNKIVPTLSPYEYDNEKQSLNLVDDFQNGALKFIKDYKDNNLNYDLNSNVCGYNLLMFGSRPSKKDLEIFGNLLFENYKVHNIINFNHKSFYYFIHPKIMIKDFYCSGWRIAFLKKLFKIPLLLYFKIVMCFV